MTQPHTGDLLDHYRIENLVARSGMASIFRATDVITAALSRSRFRIRRWKRDPVPFDRFKREQEIGEALDHPGVMKVFKDAKRSGRYMVMEWVDGQLLRGS